MSGKNDAGQVLHPANANLPDAAYRALFRTALDEAALAELRLAIQQSQPIGSERFLQHIEQMTGQRREARPRGRPRREPDGPGVLPGQMELGL